MSKTLSASATSRWRTILSALLTSASVVFIYLAARKAYGGLTALSDTPEEFNTGSASYRIAWFIWGMEAFSLAFGIFAIVVDFQLWRNGHPGLFINIKLPVDKLKLKAGKAKAK